VICKLTLVSLMMCEDWCFCRGGCKWLMGPKPWVSRGVTRVHLHARLAGWHLSFLHVGCMHRSAIGKQQLLLIMKFWCPCYGTVQLDHRCLWPSCHVLGQLPDAAGYISVQLYVLAQKQSDACTYFNPDTALKTRRGHHSFLTVPATTADNERDAAWSSG
jgi:hypothetical protein